MSGFYLMHRGWMDHPALGGRREPFCRRAAWAWLVENAKWKECQEYIAGKRVTLKRGQLSYSTRFLAEAWGWDDRRVRRFLAKCAEHDMLLLDTAAGQITVTICNYDEFQLSENTSAAEVPQECDAMVRGSAANKKEGNKGNKESTPLPPTGGASPDGEPSGLDLLGDQAAKAPSRKRTDGGTRGTRVPDGDLPDEWAKAANQTRERHCLPLLNNRALRLRWEHFQNYWKGTGGSKGLKSDWRATWLNNAIDTRTEQRFPPDRAPAMAEAGPRPQAAHWGEF
ncbi:hypothetical protein [Azospirillum sp. Sh1]|uniref:hypothetical protein n=1 Tax=Azospirillum sp. Sh1 TaxID=2607285 RepID=UPI0011ED2667|nr:hypothetical protein [Azospirillum sp. Sh1]KAA0576700.1 hypothetical protein FZ029_12600 [Azospirillum sp. Sh1]